jgi:hypothetical protein
MMCGRGRIVALGLYVGFWRCYVGFVVGSNFS